jgi:hypothetical protein
VSVIGYPVGGDSISISSGVVSRIEMQEYAQASAELLAIQIDAGSYAIIVIYYCAEFTTL